MRAHASRTSVTESGFSIVEVLIAGMLMTAVITAVSLAAVGGTQLRGASKVQAAMTAGVERIEEHLGANRAWMQRDECRTVGTTCSLDGDIAPELLYSDDLEGDFVLTSPTSEAIDSDADGLGTEDEDGLLPDFYRITFSIELSQDLQARFGEVPPRSATLTLDRRGASVLGALAIEFCEVVNQSDDRMIVQGCNESGASAMRMAGCPPGADGGCLAAFENWVQPLDHHASNPSPYVSMRRLDPGSFSVSVTNVDSGTTYGAADAVVTDGLLVFRDVEPGPYRITGLPDSHNGRERWEFKEVPSYHGSAAAPAAGPSVVVESGLRNRALVLFRPARAGGIGLYFERRTRTYSYGQLSGPSTETVFDDWQPTDGYLAQTLQIVCGLMGGGFGGGASTYSCMSGETDSYLPNCAVMRIRGQWYRTNSPDSNDFERDEDGNGILMDIPDGSIRARYCTWWNQRNEHMYHPVDRTPNWQTREGSMAPAVYSTEAKPTFRFVERAANGDIEAPVVECVVQARSQCNPAMIDLVPGLNAPFSRTVGTTTSGPAFTIGQNERCNIQWCGQPATGALPTELTSPLWVRPNGAIIAQNGTNLGVNPTYTMTGLGECYWTSPRWAGEEEGSCNPCEPLWDPGTGQSLDGACGSILVETCWTRYGIETIEWYNPQWGTKTAPEEFGAIEEKSGCVSYEPGWGCTTPVPHMTSTSVTCRPPTPAPPPTTGRTEHSTPAGASTGIGNRTVSGGAAQS